MITSTAPQARSCRGAASCAPACPDVSLEHTLFLTFAAAESLRPVILSEAKDLRRQPNRLPAIKHDHVPAQESCTPACPDVSLEHTLFLTFSCDRTV